MFALVYWKLYDWNRHKVVVASGTSENRTWDKSWTEYAWYMHIYAESLEKIILVPLCCIKRSYTT